METPKLDTSWSAMTWEGARWNTLAAGARLTLPEKVAWLEEAHHTALRLGALSSDTDAAAPEVTARDQSA